MIINAVEIYLHILIIVSRDFVTDDFTEIRSIKGLALSSHNSAMNGYFLLFGWTLSVSYSLNLPCTHKALRVLTRSIHSITGVVSLAPKMTI